jgi:uncharacterized protein (TIGR02001 family)
MWIRNGCVALIFFIAPGVYALDGQLSGNLKASSDYLFRGIDRTNSPAAQGELDYAASNGIYAGAWASNARAVGGSEVDAYAGFGRTITVRDIFPVHFDGGVITYLFPGDERDGSARHNLDFVETYASFRLGPASLKASFSPDYENAGGVATALTGRLRWPLLESLAIRLDGTLNLGPGLKQYTARLTQDGRGRDYFNYALMFDYSLPEDFRISAGIAGTTLDLANSRGRDGDQPKYLIEIGRYFDF